MTAPADHAPAVAALRAVDARGAAQEFECEGALSRLVYSDRRIRVMDLCPPRRDADAPPTRIARGHHVVLTYRGVLECAVGAPSASMTVDPTSALLLNPGDHFRLTRAAAADAWATIVSLTPEFVARLSDVSDARRDGDARRFRVPRALLPAATLLRLHRLATLLRLHRLRRAWYAGEPGAAVVEALADLAWAPDTSSQVTRAGQGAALRHWNLAEGARLLLAGAPAAAHRLEAVAGSLGSRRSIWRTSSGGTSALPRTAKRLNHHGPK